MHSVKKNIIEFLELLMKGRIKEVFQLFIYYSYKFDIIVLYYATLMPYYLIFTFCFFLETSGLLRELPMVYFSSNTYAFCIHGFL